MSFGYRLLSVLFLVVVFLFPSSVKAQTEDGDTVRRNDFKFTLLSLGSGSTRVTFEHAFKRSYTGEATLGIVGLGWDWMNESSPRGLLTKFAFKRRRIPRKPTDNWLAGIYVKPELVCAWFKYLNPDDKGSMEPKRTESTMQVALLLELGYQLVLDWFVFDLYGGLGPSAGTGNMNNYYHSFMLFPRDSHLAFTAGFRIGVGF